jgi:hypothetical protein
MTLQRRDHKSYLARPTARRSSREFSGFVTQSMSPTLLASSKDSQFQSVAKGVLVSNGNTPS